jgi:cell division protein FtsL
MSLFNSSGASGKKWFAGFRAHAKLLISRNVFVVLVMLIVVEVSAAAVIYATYKNRALFSELERMRNDAEEMQVAWHQLLLEQSTLASFSRVSEVAQNHLNMSIPDPHAVVVLRQP